MRKTHRENYFKRGVQAMRNKAAGKKKIELLIVLAKADFKKRFTGSYLGIFWMFLQPIVSVLIYYLVFQLGFKSNPVSDMPYVLWLIPGMIPWFFFNEAVMNSVGSLSAYQHLVKKIVFQVDILPLVKVMASFFLHLIFLWVLVLVYLLFGQKPSLWWLQAIYFIICNVVLIVGISYFTSAVHVFVKDMGQAVNILLQFGFWLSPIMWDFSIMPIRFHRVLKLIPFTYIVEGFRDCFVYHNGFWERPEYTLYFWVVTLAIFIGGLAIFRKTRPHFADVL